MIVLFVLAVEIFGLGPALEYRRALLASEPWRLLTAHFAHLSLTHALLNSIALMLLGRLFESRLRTTEWWILLFGAPLVISLTFWAALPGLGWYRGLSGTLHAIFFTGCVVWIGATRGRARLLPVAALAAGVIKVLVEQPWQAEFPFRDWLGAAVVPQAHLIGALVGVAAGALFHARRFRRHVAADE